MKFLRVFLVFTLVLSLCSPFVLTADASNLVKTECINVAENKPITSNALHNNTWPITNLVDGNRTTFVPAEYDAASAYGAGNEEFVIDLLRRYNVDRVELYNSVDVDREGGRQGFDIIGANNPDFSDAVVLSSKDSVIDNTAFPPTGCYTAVGDGGAYRYIKIKRTIWGYYGYGEIKVWAEQTATEVAQGKPVTANYWYEYMDTFAPEKANNGTNINNGDCWVAEEGSVGKYYFWRVDLEEAKHIGMIEFEGRYFETGAEDNIVTRKYNDVYGSNTNAENTVIEQNAELVGIGDYTRLIKTTENDVYDGECQFPQAKTASKLEMFQSTLDDRTAYRYLTYKKSYLTFAALGEFRAYVINPVVNSSEMSGQTITVNFSDEMDSAYFDNTAVSVSVDGASVNAQMIFTDDYTLKITLPELYYGAKIKVIIDSSVRNMKDVEMASDSVLLFTAPPAVDVTEFKIQDAKEGDGNEVTALSQLSTEAGVKVTVRNNKADNDETAVVLLLLYDENNALVKADVKHLDIEAQSPSSVTAGFTLPQNTEGFSLKALLWRDFSLMQRWTEAKTIR